MKEGPPGGDAVEERVNKGRLSPALPPKGPKGRTFLLALAALAALLLLSTAVQARSAEARLASLRMEGGRTLAAGQEIRVAWDALPGDTREFELLLRCDLPEPLTVRLTESQDPRLQGFLWRVPNVPCLSARLLLRRGEGEGEESVWAESDAFRIRSESGREVSQVVRLRGELWLPEGKHRRAPAGWGESSRVDCALGRLPAGAVAPSSKVLSPGTSPTWTCPQGTTRAARARAGSVRSRHPLLVQLRI